MHTYGKHTKAIVLYSKQITGSRSVRESSKELDEHSIFIRRSLQSMDRNYMKYVLRVRDSAVK